MSLYSTLHVLNGARGLKDRIPNCGLKFLKYLFAAYYEVLQH